MNTEKSIPQMIVKIKKTHPDAIIPKYAKEGDAGLDLTAVSKKYDEYGNICYGTGLAFEIPLGYVGLVFPRSSICKKPLLLSNSVGVIDSGYRGEVSLKFRPGGRDIYEIGDRIGQIIIMPYPYIHLEEVEGLSMTERGDGGYGSSGR